MKNLFNINQKNILPSNNKRRGLFTWPNQDDQMNMTEIVIFFTFGQIQLFSIKFNKLMFLVVIFRSCSNSKGLSTSVIFIRLS